MNNQNGKGSKWRKTNFSAYFLNYDEIDSLEKVPAHIPKEIAHFYEEMKKLANKAQ